MILGITGHRPSSLGCGYNIPNLIFNKVYNSIKQKFIELKPEKIISGAAQGVDTWAIMVAKELNIPYIAAVPFDGQDSLWPDSAKEEYNKILNSAERVVVVSFGLYSAEKMQIRNRWIVDNSDCLLAVWNGINRGGTYYTVKYAENKPQYSVHKINPKEL